jgi:hypothetical protein
MEFCFSISFRHVLKPRGCASEGEFSVTDVLYGSCGCYVTKYLTTSYSLTAERAIGRFEDLPPADHSLHALLAPPPNVMTSMFCIFAAFSSSCLCAAPVRRSQKINALLVPARTRPDLSELRPSPLKHKHVRIGLLARI